MGRKRDMTEDRRGFLTALGAAGGLALCSPLIWTPGSAEAGGRARVTRMSRGKRGTTIYLELRHGPFPCPGKPYKDSTTIVFVPHHYRVMDDYALDVLVHFHGHNTTAARAMERHQLREQFHDSKQNALLVMPQGPINAASSSGGKLERPGGLERFLAEVRRALQQRRVARRLGRAHIPRRARVSKLCLSAHSGGYHVVARCLKHGGYNVNEVFLFDALYGDVRFFRDWVLERKGKKGDERHKLVSFYNTHSRVRQGNMRLLREFSRAKIKCLHETKEGTLPREEFTRGRVIFIKTRVSHNGLTHRHNNLRDCLFASCFTRRLRSRWFDKKGRARKIDKRETKRPGAKKR